MLSIRSGGRMSPILSSKMGATVTPTPADNGKRRIVVIANEACVGQRLFDEVRERRGDGADAEVILVAPALASNIRYRLSGEDRGIAEAQARADESVERCGAAGIPVTAYVGDPDPLQALDDAVRLYHPDEVLVATHPPDRVNWLEEGFVAQAQARFTLPITHLVVDREAGQSTVDVDESRSPSVRRRRDRREHLTNRRSSAAPGVDRAFESTSALRRRSVGNLLRMGHCAPSVMTTLLEASGSTERWPILLTAGLPGGIGNTGGECGGLTVPLVAMGLEHGRVESDDGLPVVVEAAHDLLDRFAETQGTTQCREIRGTSRVPLRCVGVVRDAPGMCAACVGAPTAEAIEPEVRAAYQRQYEHWKQRGFHCADAVLSESALSESATSTVPEAELRDAVTAFMGGTVFTGMTCSALTAGVMALGLALGEIEDSHARVAKMIATMAVRGDAFANDMNAFNRVMNLGHDLSKWFEAEFGSTQCRALTGCDFASMSDVDNYIDRDGTSDCVACARRVAEQVAAMIDVAARES